MTSRWIRLLASAALAVSVITLLSRLVAEGLLPAARTVTSVEVT